MAGSLATNVDDLALAVATELKSHKTLINGNAADLSSLTTTAKTNLVVAVNEIDGRVDDIEDAVGAASGIDDGTTSGASTWSSSKISTELGTNSTGDRARANHTGTQSADTLTDGTTNKAFLATERTKLSGIATSATANSADATLLARANHTGTQTAATISDFDAAADARIDLRVAGAPAALDTLDELAAAIGDDANFATTVTTALGNRVRYDAAQSLTDPQKVQARSNIGAASAADLGDVTSFDPVATFEAGLV